MELIRKCNNLSFLLIFYSFILLSCDESNRKDNNSFFNSKPSSFSVKDVFNNVNFCEKITNLINSESLQVFIIKDGNKYSNDIKNKKNVDFDLLLLEKKADFILKGDSSKTKSYKLIILDTFNKNEIIHFKSVLMPGLQFFEFDVNSKIELVRYRFLEF